MQTNNNFKDINYFITNEQNPINAHIVYNPRANTFIKLYSERELKEKILETKIKINDLIQKSNEKLDSSVNLFNDVVLLLKKSKIEKTNEVEKDENIKISQEDYYEQILNTLNNFISKTNDLETRFISCINQEIKQKLDDELLKTRVDIYKTNLTICENFLEINKFFMDYFELVIKKVDPEKNKELDVNNFAKEFSNKLSALYEDYAEFKKYVESYEEKIAKNNSILNKTPKTNNTNTTFKDSSYGEVCNKIEKCIKYIYGRNKINNFFKTQLTYKWPECLQEIENFYSSKTNKSALTKTGIFQDINEHIKITNLINKSIEDLNAIIKNSGSKITLIALGEKLNGNLNPVNKNLGLKEEEEKLIIPKINNITNNSTNNKNIFEEESDSSDSNLLNKKTERSVSQPNEFKEIDSNFNLFKFYETSGFKKFVDDVDSKMLALTSKNAKIEDLLNNSQNLKDFEEEITNLKIKIKEILESCFNNKAFDNEGKLTNTEAQLKIDGFKFKILEKISNLEKRFSNFEKNENISLAYENSNNNLNNNNLNNNNLNNNIIFNNNFNNINFNNINFNNNLNKKSSSYSNSFYDYSFDEYSISNLESANEKVNNVDYSSYSDNDNDNDYYFILDEFNNNLKTKITDLKERYDKVRAQAKEFLSYYKFEVEINGLKKEINTIFDKYFKNGKDFDSEEIDLKEAKEKIKKLEDLINSKLKEFDFLLRTFEKDQKENNLDNNSLAILQDFYAANKFMDFSNDIAVKMYFLNQKFNKLIENSNLTENEISSLNYDKVKNEINKLKENIKRILNNCFEKKEFDAFKKITNKNAEDEIDFLKTLIESKIFIFENELNEFLK